MVSGTFPQPFQKSREMNLRDLPVARLLLHHVAKSMQVVSCAERAAQAAGKQL